MTLTGEGFHSPATPIAMYHRLVIFWMLISVSALGHARPFISAEALHAQLDKPNLVILDFQPAHFFRQAHIPGAVNTDYNDWRRKNAAGLGKMLPEGDALGAMLGDLGINQDSQVVITPLGVGADDLTAAARMFWTLHVAGLDDIAILEGGLLNYIEAIGQSALEPGFSLPIKTDFVPQLRQADILNIDDVAAHVEAGQLLVDTRSPEEFVGDVAGAPNERPGALPGAVNLPFDSLMRADQRGLLPTEELNARFDKAGVPLRGEQISYCHTGHRTSLVWFISHEVLGNPDARLYDGSTLEWSSTSDRPLVMRQ